ncbi:MAG: hypothetical protein M5Z89_06230 [Olivibacter sp.]|nr:hypothetical protein [Olivibacter sp. UJ_SKK_5.1]
MKEHLKSSLHALISKVLDKAGITAVKASDCGRLSIDIYSETGYKISVTTLKRIFGFAEAPYFPSRFTLDALARYGGFRSWSDFVVERDSKHHHTDASDDWRNIVVAANRITRFTITRNKVTSGISYRYTIHRKWMDEHITAFHKSNSTACLISAPLGGGKTIGITHWIDKQLTDNQKKNGNDVYLLVNGSSLIYATGFGFHADKWLAQLLDFPNQALFENFMQRHANNAPGNFYVVIDDFNDRLANDRIFEMAFRQLVDMVSHLAPYRWLKIVVALRPYTWHKYGHIVEGHEVTRRQWFTSFSVDESNFLENMPGFMLSELNELILKINGSQSALLDSSYRALSFMARPLNFQFFYHLNNNSLPVEKLNTDTEYPITEHYLKSKIFDTADAYQRQKAMERLVDIVTFNRGMALVNKKALLSNAKAEYYLINELLQLGILEEFRVIQGTRASYFLRFRSVLIATYFVAKKALENARYAEERLRGDGRKANLRLSISKWLIGFQLANERFDLLNDIIEQRVNQRERASLLIFAGRRFETNDNNSVIASWLRNSQFIDTVFDHLLIRSDYLQLLRTLSRYELIPRQYILINSALAFYHFCRLEDEKVAEYIEKLKEISPEYYAEFSLNPLYLLEGLHLYYKLQISSNNWIEEISSFCRFAEHHATLTHKHLFFIVAYLLLFNGTDQNIIYPFALAIDKYVPESKEPFNLKAFSYLLKAHFYAQSGNIPKSFLHRHAASAYVDNSIINRLHLLILDLRLAKNGSLEYIFILRKLVRFYRHAGIKYAEAATLALLINQSTAEKSSADLSTIKRLSALFDDSNYSMQNLLTSVMRFVH